MMATMHSMMVPLLEDMVAFREQLEALVQGVHERLEAEDIKDKWGMWFELYII